MTHPNATLAAFTTLEGTLRLFLKCCEAGLVERTDQKDFVKAFMLLSQDEIQLAANGTDTELTVLAAKVAKQLGQMH